jgi:hypothetical protein
MSSTAFRLSRIYAEGWNKAQQLSAGEADALDTQHTAALNPYTSEPEKSRWNDGFTKAMGSAKGAISQT